MDATDRISDPSARFRERGNVSGRTRSGGKYHTEWWRAKCSAPAPNTGCSVDSCEPSSSVSEQQRVDLFASSRSGEREADQRAERDDGQLDSGRHGETQQTHARNRLDTLTHLSN